MGRYVAARLLGGANRAATKAAQKTARENFQVGGLRSSLLLCLSINKKLKDLYCTGEILHIIRSTEHNDYSLCASFITALVHLRG